MIRASSWVWPFAATWLLLALFLPGCLYADGGVLQFRREAGPLLVTVFSVPTPLRAGMADLSVMVQSKDAQSEITDAQVEIHLQKPGKSEVQAHATHQQTANRLMYSAVMKIPEAGNWKIDVTVNWNSVHQAISGDLDVQPELGSLAHYWPYIVLAPGGVLLFALHQHLKIRRAMRT